MEAKQIAVAAAGTAAVVGLGWLARRTISKMVAKKAVTPELVATAKTAVELSRINANNELINNLKAKSGRGPGDRSPLEATFDHVYANIDTLLDFDPRWKNGTGYFNGAQTVGLANGNMAKATGDCGRRLILIGTEFGTAVFFERFTLGHGPFVVVHNSATQYRDQLPNGSLTVEQFKDFISAMQK